jgi:DUF1680 family protein
MTTGTITKLQPIPISQVTIHDTFWEPQIRRNREVSIPAIYQLCQDTNRIAMLQRDWKPGPGQEAHFFWDSDVAKWIEAASYSLTTHPDPVLEQRVDEVIDLFAAIQQEDGYLNSYFINIAPEYRWTNFSFFHELYCAGHLIEAGVAHFQATRKRKLLDVVCLYADHIDSRFRVRKQPGFPGHQEIELALVKLYRVTGEERYLTLSQYFLDQRGNTNLFRAEGQRLPPHVAEWYRKLFGEGDKFSTAYSQDHLSIRQQTKAVGHAVRAMYMYSAMANVAYETGEQALLDALKRLWENVCYQQMYITGGIGPSRYNEGFTEDYDLPNLTAYAETCAAIGMIFWNYRMFHLEPHRRYMDILERVLYNGAICGVSLDGKLFFYENPLQSKGNHHRQTWFSVSCCPPNLARLLASLGQYIYSHAEREVFVNLYIQSEARLQIGEQQVVLQQITKYPWEEIVQLTVQTEQTTRLTLNLRIPEWCRRAEVSVNGASFDVANATTNNGYGCIDREWNPGDQVTLTLAMPVEQIEAHPAVQDDIGCVALQRGPVVYCLEQCDHLYPLHQIVLPRDATFTARFEPDLLHGVVVLTTEGLTVDDKEPRSLLYRQDASLTYKPCQITAIPYYAWDNRQPGAMRVWIRALPQSKG